jgi:hypothetical protein
MGQEVAIVNPAYELTPSIKDRLQQALNNAQQLRADGETLAGKAAALWVEIEEIFFDVPASLGDAYKTTARLGKSTDNVKGELEDLVSYLRDAAANSEQLN